MQQFSNDDNLHNFIGIIYRILPWIGRDWKIIRELSLKNTIFLRCCNTFSLLMQDQLIDNKCGQALHSSRSHVTSKLSPYNCVK